MAEGFAKCSARNFGKKLDRFRSERVGTVKITNKLWKEHLLKVKIAEVKGLQPCGN